jgi:GNAT superfamily N-acetyltransferase
MSDFRYQLEPGLETTEFIDCLIRSTLSQRRPIDQPSVIAGMLRNASIVMTCRNDSGLLIGVARAITDFHYCTYLSDLAVDQAFQGQGIGQRLIQKTHDCAGVQTTLVLLAAPAAESYYPHVGMKQHASAWIIPRVT